MKYIVSNLPLPETATGVRLVNADSAREHRAHMQGHVDAGYRLHTILNLDGNLYHVWELVEPARPKT